MGVIRNVMGPPVEGNDFFGRTEEIAEVLKLLEEGNNLILAAPRRVGKTSFARKLLEETGSKGWKGFFIDLQKPKSEFDFMKRFLKEVKGKNWLLEHFPDIIKLDIGPATMEFNRQKPDFYRKTEDALPHNEDTLIVFDEFVIFLDEVLRNRQDKDNEFESMIHFLNWLRSLRQTGGSRIRWIFCSSISIESYLHKHQLTKTINDLFPFKIGELKGDEPRLLVKALADSKSIDFSDEYIGYMLEKLGWNLPYFIQILFNKVKDERPLSREAIDEAYNNLLDIDTHFNTWTERLSYYDDDARFAKLILNELSRSKRGKKKNNLYDLVSAELNDAEKTDTVLPLLGRMETDGYIMNDKDTFTFRSPLLRDFWFRQFGK